jgi:hypothetical protein
MNKLSLALGAGLALLTLVKFDQKQADEYFAKVNRKVAALINETRRKWDAAGL